MPYWQPVPHGPKCECDTCRGQRILTTERLSSTDRLAWLESQVLQLRAEIAEIKKGNNKMGYALWCQPGSHSFDENEEGAKRITTDREDSKGNSQEITVHVCRRHAADLFKPRPKSLATLRQELEEATEIGE